MPFVNGKRVSLDEWKALRDYREPEMSVDEEQTDAILGKPTTRQRKATVRAAALAATGAVIEDEEPETTEEYAAGIE